MIYKSIIIFIGLMFIIIGTKQSCNRCKYQAGFGGLVYLGFLFAPKLGVAMTVAFLVSQYLVNKFIRK